MSNTLDECRTDYRRALAEFLAGRGDEAASLRAYELGRHALTNGVGLLEMATVHHDALASTLAAPCSPEHAAASLRSAELFFLESLAPFEMSHRMVDEANTTLRRLNHTLEEEAKRIAHALHDEAGGILAAARIQLDMATQDLPPAALAQLEVVRRLLDETGERLRHLSHELRPAVLDDLGLRKALDFLAQGISQRTGIKATVVGELRDRPAAAVELAVYRVVQEALSNAVRHAGKVSWLTVRLRRQRGALHCVIQDDGAGFDVEATLGDKSRAGLGLLGMRERVHAVGGSLNIRSAPQEGTAVEILIPLEK
jgi:signal transduction histidine kinase